MGILSGNPANEPMHYGEVAGVWGYLFTIKNLFVLYQVFLNHTGDKDLREFIQDTLNDQRDEIQQIENLLKENEVPLPPSPPERPYTSLENIPVGARINDPEVAAAISREMALGLVSCSSVMGQCLREDIALMFGKFHFKKTQMGSKLLRMSKEKGWIVVPPLHNFKKEAVTV